VGPTIGPTRTNERPGEDLTPEETPEPTEPRSTSTPPPGTPHQKSQEEQPTGEYMTGRETGRTHPPPLSMGRDRTAPTMKRRDPIMPTKEAPPVMPTEEVDQPLPLPVEGDEDDDDSVIVEVDSTQCERATDGTRGERRPPVPETPKPLRKDPCSEDVPIETRPARRGEDREFPQAVPPIRIHERCPRPPQGRKLFHFDVEVWSETGDGTRRTIASAVRVGEIDLGKRQSWLRSRTLAARLRRAVYLGSRHDTGSSPQLCVRNR